MRLRPYQERTVASIRSAFESGETATLITMPTGGGKTIVLSAAAAAYAEVLGRPPHVLVLQHRQELVSQNQAKFRRVNRTWCTAQFDAKHKRFARPSGYDGAATFAMVPSLSTERSLKRIPHVDLVIMDEAHHALAATWRAVLDRVLEVNPDARLLGVTATPQRGDGQPLGEIFGHVAETVSIGELIDGGYLVQPRAMVVEGGMSAQLRSVKRTSGGRGDYDMTEVARLIDHEPITQAVIARWREVAGRRQTAVFCSTVEHARHVAAAFGRAGVTAGVVTGEDAREDRQRTLRDYDQGRLQVVVNVMTLTEGWDHQPTSCVVLLRPSAFRSLVIQMLGRGLRIVDPTVYPTAPPKSDCIALDFGASLENLGGLESVLEIGQPRREREPGIPPMKPCHECRRPIPLSARECPLCGYEYPAPRPETIPLIAPDSIRLRPYELVLQESPFRWINLTRDADGHIACSRRDTRARIACSERVWSVLFSDRGGIWHAFGAVPMAEERPDGTVGIDKRPRHLASGSQSVAISRADDFLREHGQPKRYGKLAGYHRLEPTPAQQAFAQRLKINTRGLRRYEVHCLITAKTNRSTLERLLPDVQSRVEQVFADEPDRREAASA